MIIRERKIEIRYSLKLVLYKNNTSDGKIFAPESVSVNDHFDVLYRHIEVLSILFRR